MLPATFELAFAGLRSELAKKMDVSIRLLNMLLDREIITHEHYEYIKVSASLLCCIHQLMHSLLMLRQIHPCANGRFCY